MVFSSVTFLFAFLPFVLAGYYLLDRRFKNIWLLLASLGFYAWGEPKNIVLMLLSIAANYFFARAIAKFRAKKALQNAFFAAAVVFNVGMLLVFKYTDFFISNANSIFRLEIPLKNIALPIGISFFTFQSLSYVIDVKRDVVPPQNNVLRLGLYISFFPQLIAGPIVRYSDIAAQIDSREISLDKFHKGILRFMKGFSKKVLLADQLALYADPVFAREGISAPCAWFAVVAYTLQIYFDFSGYSDMAIGLGKMFGFDFNENFDHPYISKSAKEFWRRWHISLSTWFRDYVYIPLGGSRCSKARAAFNLAIVFFLTGFWHGASWNFVVFGLYYAAFLLLERLVFGKALEKAPAAAGHFYAILVVLFGFVIFRSEGMRTALHYAKAMFTINSESLKEFVLLMDRKAIFCAIAGIVFSLPVGEKIKASICAKSSLAYDFLIFAMFVVAISFLMAAGFSPFLYFRF